MTAALTNYFQRLEALLDQVDGVTSDGDEDCLVQVSDDLSGMVPEIVFRADVADEQPSLRMRYYPMYEDTVTFARPVVPEDNAPAGFAGLAVSLGPDGVVTSGAFVKEVGDEQGDVNPATDYGASDEQGGVFGEANMAAWQVRANAMFEQAEQLANVVLEAA